MQFDERMKKSKLLWLVKIHPSTTVCLADVIAEAAGHSFLYLPVPHCKLNPIDLVWAQVKDCAARHNKCLPCSRRWIFVLKELLL